MSAFIVKDSCIHNIIHNLFKQEFRQLHDTLKDAGYVTSEDYDRFGNELSKMNGEAIRQRYEEVVEVTQKSNWWVLGTEDEYQALKSMHCLRYQCLEGDVPKSKLYKLLDECIRNFADHICTNTKRYEKAEWD